MHMTLEAVLGERRAVAQAAVERIAPGMVDPEIFIPINIDSIIYLIRILEDGCEIPPQITDFLNLPSTNAASGVNFIITVDVNQVLMFQQGATEEDWHRFLRNIPKFKLSHGFSIICNEKADVDMSEHENFAIVESILKLYSATIDLVTKNIILVLT
mgnify:CR=1 FL=1